MTVKNASAGSKLLNFDSSQRNPIHKCKAQERGSLSNFYTVKLYKYPLELKKNHGTVSGYYMANGKTIYSPQRLT